MYQEYRVVNHHPHYWYVNNCVLCNKYFLSRQSGTTSCGEKRCSNEYSKQFYINKHQEIWQERKCAICGKVYYKAYGRNGPRNVCSIECQKRRLYLERRKRKAQRKNQMKNGERVDIKILLERDNYKCGICNKRVNANYNWEDQYAATIDHIIPLSLGGEHTYQNTRIAHNICNRRRSNRISKHGEQLFLY
jgi:5-methylcytosine-specific restriction endonuclease McrA